MSLKYGGIPNVPLTNLDSKPAFIFIYYREGGVMNPDLWFLAIMIACLLSTTAYMILA